MVAQTIIESVEGTVGRTNGHGFTLAGRDGWLNISKYAMPAPALPDEGARVVVGLDKAGYVRSIEALSATTTAAVEPFGCSGQSGEDISTPGPVDRETHIGRLAVLNTATSILSSGGRAVEPVDALALAAKLEAWVNR